jgi:hypothetical protein
MKAAELIKPALDMAEMALTVQGELAGQLFLHSKKGIVALPYKNCKREEVGMQQALYIHIIRGCRMAGDFLGLVLVAEAWVSVQNKENLALAQVMRPAQDPDRKEVVVAWSYGDDGSKAMATADIIRDGEKVKLGERKTLDEGGKSWLDDAFEDYA